MALRDGKPYLAWGSPGGDQQDQWIPQMFLRHVHAKMNLQQAIDAPAWHTEHFPTSFWPRMARPGVIVVEGRMPKATIEELRRRGHIVEVGPAWSEGRLTAASRDGTCLEGGRQSARHAGLRRRSVTRRRSEYAGQAAWPKPHVCAQAHDWLIDRRRARFCEGAGALVAKRRRDIDRPSGHIRRRVQAFPVSVP